MKISLVLLCAPCLFGATPPIPGGGIIERQLEQEYEAAPLQPYREVPEVEIDLPEEQMELPSDQCVEVNSVRLRGVQSIPEEEIQGWIAGCLGRKVCLKEIYVLCEMINQGYAAKGYFLARSYPPPQTIEEGVLTLDVLEGHLGNITVEGNAYYSTSFIRSYFTWLEGEPLFYDRFMRAILLLNENSDLQAGAIFTKGEKVGTADVVIRVEDSRPIHLYLNANNYGRKLTTNFRVGGRADIGNLFTYGDTFSLVEVVGFPIHALYFTDGVYRVPLNRNGSFLELSYLYSFFTVEELLSLGMKGHSNIGMVKGSHALYRSRALSIDLFSYFDLIQIKNLSFGATLSYDKLRVLRAGVVIDGKGSRNMRHYLNARASFGIPNFLGALPSVSNLCSRQGAGGLFIKFNADYDYLQLFATDCLFTFHVSLQRSLYKLAVPEEIYLGGSDTVRGFPLAVVLGDSGYYANLELKIPPPILANFRFFLTKKKWREVVQIAGFLDHGGTFFYGGSDNFLWGTGVGVRVRGPFHLALSLDVGFPLNHDNFSTGAITYIKVTGQPF